MCSSHYNITTLCPTIYIRGLHLEQTQQTDICFFYDFSPVLPDYYFVSKFHFLKKSVSQYVVLAAGLCFVSECYLFSSVFTFKEKEGKTFVLSRSLVETLGYQFDYPCRMITLEVHSSLSAVGK